MESTPSLDTSDVRPRMAWRKVAMFAGSRAIRWSFVERWGADAGLPIALAIRTAAAVVVLRTK